MFTVQGGGVYPNERVVQGGGGSGDFSGGGGMFTVRGGGGVCSLFRGGGGGIWKLAVHFYRLFRVFCRFRPF